MRILRTIVLLCALVPAAVAHAQLAPGRTLTLVVPYATGGGYDRVARLIAPRLGEALQQNVVVENRPGAGGTLGMSTVAKAPPDGSQLVVAGPGDIAIAPFLYTTRLNYNTTRDFVPIIMMARFSLVLAVNPALGVESVADLLKLAKSRATPLTTAISSVGSTGHLSAELFKSATGITTVNVPYKGTGPALSDLSGGHVDMMFTEPGSVMPFVKSGKVKVLAVTTEARSQALPDVPTMIESGFPGYQVSGWWGLFAPAGTPAAVVREIERQVAVILKTPAFDEAIRALTAEVSGLSGEPFVKVIQGDIARFGQAVKSSGIKLE
jgi:tripartite-type tricarboxylate transporter receptor subunit TctC